jgi:hypothetical protein
MPQDPSIDAMIDKIYATISPEETQAQRHGEAEPQPVAPLQARERRTAAPVESVPRHYQLADGSDLYDIELRLYGFAAWWAHAQMQVLEYMERAQHADAFDRDLMKAIRILERARAEYAKRPREERA